MSGERTVSVVITVDPAPMTELELVGYVDAIPPATLVVDGALTEREAELVNVELRRRGEGSSVVRVLSARLK